MDYQEQRTTSFRTTFSPHAAFPSRSTPWKSGKSERDRNGRSRKIGTERKHKAISYKAWEIYMAATFLVSPRFLNTFLNYLGWRESFRERAKCDGKTAVFAARTVWDWEFAIAPVVFVSQLANCVHSPSTKFTWNNLNQYLGIKLCKSSSTRTLCAYWDFVLHIQSTTKKKRHELYKLY